MKRLIETFAVALSAISFVSTSFAQNSERETALESDSQNETVSEMDLSHLSEETQAVIKDLEATLRDMTENGETFEKLEHAGDLYLQLGEVQRALLVFDKAIKDFGGTEELYQKFARVLLASERPELAVKTLTIGLEAFPDSDLLSYELGRLYVAQRKAYAARAQLEPLVEKDPENDSYRYTLADSYRIQKRWGEAMEIIDALIEEGTEYLPAFLMKGDLLLATGELRDGVRYLEDVLEDYPESADVKRVLVHAYQLYGYSEADAGLLDNAAQAMRDAIEIDPNNGESRVGLASLLQQQGEVEESEKVFKETIEQDPAYLGAYLMYGNFLLAQERNHEAGETFLAGLKKARELGVAEAVEMFQERLSGKK